MYFLHEKVSSRLIKRHPDPTSNLFLVQDIRAHQEPIWCAKFSPCGHYLATGGKDGVLKIWEINHNGELESKKQRNNEQMKSYGGDSSNSSNQEKKKEKLKEKQINHFYHLLQPTPLR